MGEYEISSKFITDQTDYRLAVSGIAYEIEKLHVNGVKKGDVQGQINKLKNRHKFPSNLDYVDSFYDQKSGLSGVAFKDSNTGKVTVGFAGTNVNADGLVDIVADARIAWDAYSADSSYFSEGHRFLNNLANKNYDVEYVTGHSKGGRDAMILGISHQIPNIITYNPAPISNLEGTDLIDSIDGIIPNRAMAIANLTRMKLMKDKYTGRIIHYVTKNDPLNNITRMFGSIYPGETIVIPTGSISLFEGHDLENFSSGQGGMNYRLLLIDAQEGILNSDGAGLTSSQKIYLDANRALAIASSFRDFMLEQQQELDKSYKQWIQEAKENWISAKKKAHAIGQHLSVGEELSALESGGCTQSVIETKPIQKLTQRRAKVKSTIDDCKKLIDQYKTVINHQVETDQELSRMFG